MSFAQETTRPLRIVVPFPAGGSTDMVPRNMQDVLPKLLGGQAVVIENKAGAGGSIGMAEVARATDGVTFGIATLSTHGVNPAVFKKLPYDAINDFVGVTEIVKAPGVIVINPKLVPANNFAEFVKYLKANPGKVSFATPGNGTIGHMWGELFKSSTGTSMVHIPYRGAGPAINDVLAGQVAVYFDQVASSLPHVKSGKLKALAVSWPERLDVLPDVPTYAELGYKDLTEVVWMGLWTTPDVPAANQARLRDAVLKVMQSPKVREQFAGLGLEMGSGATPDELSRGLRAASDKQAATLKAIGFKPE